MKKKEKKRRTGRKKGTLSNILLTVVLLTGLGVMLYPTVSDYWNSLHQTRAIANYDEVVAELDETDYEALFAAAEEYNVKLHELGAPYSEHEELEELYYSVLDVAGNGIIGHISIPKIGVNLPVYHGTSDPVLNVAVGHLEGSSLPIGGEGRHSVMSAHRGLPSAKLFTDLDRMEKGDIFILTVLNRTLTYEVDQILIVEPTQMEALNVTRGKDYCTLLTCTPYGINSHRMLVRGHRIDNIEEEKIVIVAAEARKIPSYYVIPAVGIPLLFVTLVIMLILSGRKRSGKTGEELLEEFKRDNEFK
ncbi:MAG: class C sortase [Lachnospiraceae bacterium]|nr:class C sortase [Lachnospiraceae bacterium]